jgi:hypothetical protein
VQGAGDPDAAQGGGSEDAAAGDAGANAADATATQASRFRDPISPTRGTCRAPNLACPAPPSDDAGANLPDPDAGDPDAGDPAAGDPDAGDAAAAGPTVCVPVLSDPTNCGACGNVCTGPGATCIAGNCACMGSLFDYCPGTGCMDVSGDDANCGACGNACGPMTTCAQGVCVAQ